MGIRLKRPMSYHVHRSYHESLDALWTRQEKPRQERTEFCGGGRANEYNMGRAEQAVRPMDWHIVRNIVRGGRASLIQPLPSWIQ